MREAMTRRDRTLLAGWGLFALLISGCGGLRYAPVSGRVTVNDQPVTEGVIMFTPVEPGPTAVGAIQPDGTFTLTTVKPGDGTVVGQHRVTIQATRAAPGSMVEAKSLEEESVQAAKRGKILVPGAVTWLVPQKYSRLETSDLSAEVLGEPNTINFDLRQP
jgi:hypothetical protein